MEQEKNKSGANILLVFITIILAILCILFATDTIDFKAADKCKDDNSNVENTRQTTMYDVMGTYTAKFENLKSDGDINTATVTLNLYDNGVFTYVFNQYAPIGTLGNYIVDGDTIVLKYWFNTDSGTGLHVTGGTKVLTINSDGSITDNTIKVKSLIDNEITTVNLVSDANSSPFDLSSRLSAAFFNEADHTISDPAM